MQNFDDVHVREFLLFVIDSTILTFENSYSIKWQNDRAMHFSWVIVSYSFASTATPLYSLQCIYDSSQLLCKWFFFQILYLYYNNICLCNSIQNNDSVNPNINCTNAKKKSFWKYVIHLIPCSSIFGEIISSKVSISLTLKLAVSSFFFTYRYNIQSVGAKPCKTDRQLMMNQKF